jgi:hypothetical protein
MSKKKYTKEFLLEALIDLSKRKNTNNLSKEDVDSDKLCPCSATYKRYFGNWSVALGLVGLKTGIITGRPPDEPIVLSKKAIEIINGELLGDGHISSSGSNSSFQHSTANLEYGEFVYKKLNENDVPLLKDKILPTRNNGNDQFHTRSVSNVTFSKMRELWYPLGEKIVPNSIELTPDVCLHWFLGDGSFEHPGGCLLLYTCCFSKEDVYLLADKLVGIGITATLNKDGAYYMIRIWKKSTNDFLDYIGECPVKSYEYKWGVGRWIKKIKKTTNIFS